MSNPGIRYIYYYVLTEIQNKLSGIENDIINAKYDMILKKEIDKERNWQPLARFIKENVIIDDKYYSNIIDIFRVHDVIVFSLICYEPKDVKTSTIDLWQIAKNTNIFSLELPDNFLGNDIIYFFSVDKDKINDLSQLFLKDYFRVETETTKEICNSFSIYKLPPMYAINNGQFLLIYEKGKENEVDDIIDRYFISHRTFVLKIYRNLIDVKPFIQNMKDFVKKVVAGEIDIDEQMWYNYNYNIMSFENILNNANRNIRNMQLMESEIDRVRIGENSLKFMNWIETKLQKQVEEFKYEIELLNENKTHLCEILEYKKTRIEKKEIEISPVLNFIKEIKIKEIMRNRLKKWDSDVFSLWLWGCDVNPLFPDHGKIHIKRIEGIAADFLKNHNKVLNLNDIEIFLLINSIWLHDIGMAGNFIEEDRREIRKKHALFSKQRIEFEWESLGLSSVQESYIIGLIALYHSSKTPLTPQEQEILHRSGRNMLTKNICPETIHFSLENIESTIRIRLLCALLRLFDVLDIGVVRLAIHKKGDWINNVIVRLDEEIEKASDEKSKEKYIKLKKEYVETKNHYEAHTYIKGLKIKDTEITFIIDPTADDTVKDFLKNEIIKEDIITALQVLKKYGIPDIKVNIKAEGAC